ncbi:hypothetical protein KC19_2G284900 [Ceratodon purpureus]|uniref:Uncharacterized protein n=1 Tax=Ceratodon purpureus TaxID=3225 RepID=A0A8T0J078_CERPU|nr:hypothetical protein KC19_2G284900 [Ceratodon purpureus]
MAKDLMQTGILDSQFLTTIWPYVALIVLAMTSLQFLRLVISTIFTVLRLLIRVVLFLISWPIYLILLPGRAFIFLTKLTIKITFYVAMAAIVYELLGGALDEMIKESLGHVLQYVQTTFLQQ